MESGGSGQAPNPIARALDERSYRGDNVTTTFSPATGRATGAANISVASTASTSPFTFGNIDDATGSQEGLGAAAFTDRLSDAATQLPTITTMTTSEAPPGPDSGSNVVMIVGVACGAVGILLGIIITAAVWIYVQKRRSSSTRPCRHASVVEKNPKEMTFEPLDLTLTLPSYSHVAAAVSEKPHSTPGSQVHLENAPPMGNRGSYHSYDAPTPPLPGDPSYDQGFVGTYGRPRALLTMGDDYSYVNDRFFPYDDLSGSFSDVSAVNHHQQNRTNRYSAKTRNNNNRSKQKEHAMRLSSITTRDSFSSGLGTGTESDTLPHEHHRTNRPRYNHVPADGFGDHREQQPRARALMHTPNTDVLDIVREGSVRRSKRSNASGHRRRMARASDGSSSYPSSRTPSVNGWSTDTSYSPSSTLPPATSSPLSSTLLPSKPPEPVFATAPRDHDSGGVITEESCDYGNVRSDTDLVAHDDGGDDGDDVVSTYFDMHFPPTPLRTNANSLKRTASVPAAESGASSRKNGQVRAGSLQRRNSDDTINL